MRPDLNPDECRVLGTLIEKAQTTPNQYPLTLNSLVTGVNQKSNRWPVITIDELRALRALDGLRSKGLVREVSMSGSRVEKFRHVAREAIGAGTNELVLLTELMLRGPQTVGELRTHGSRMVSFESLEAVEAVLAEMAKAEPPLVRELPPSPGSRAPRWAQLLCPSLHPLDAPAASHEGGSPSSAGGSDRLEARIEALEARIAELAEQFEALKRSLGA
ncbi:MAG: YceH family protein [Phycisphaerae bacterium]|jgi:uncharacterized protein YceH (UPF0502 family)|nr:YceH family protein [Phycisphaerae bacterium]